MLEEVHQVQLMLYLSICAPNHVSFILSKAATEGVAKQAELSLLAPTNFLLLLVPDHINCLHCGLCLNFEQSCDDMPSQAVSTEQFAY